MDIYCSKCHCSCCDAVVFETIQFYSKGKVRCINLPLCLDCFETIKNKEHLK